MPTPNPGFVASLNALDSLLSVRWGSIASQWVIERRANIPPSEIVFLEKRYRRLASIARDPNHQQNAKAKSDFKSVAEELDAAKRSHRVLIFADRLDDKIYNMLCLSDIRRYGGYSRMADELEADEQRAAADLARVRANERDAVHKEVFDILNFIWRKKETLLLDGEKNLNKLLHGKHSNKPIIKTA